MTDIERIVDLETRVTHMDDTIEAKILKGGSKRLTVEEIPRHTLETTDRVGMAT